MIDRKPFRVTNEQIDAIRICHSQVRCSDCKYEKTLDDCNPTKLQLAADLLDARDLIDKQKAIIKEAVAIIDHARKYGIDNACSCDDCKKADSFLEKTKDYA